MWLNCTVPKVVKIYLIYWATQFSSCVVKNLCLGPRCASQGCILRSGQANSVLCERKLGRRWPARRQSQRTRFSFVLWVTSRCQLRQWEATTGRELQTTPRPRLRLSVVASLHVWLRRQNRNVFILQPPLRLEYRCFAFTVWCSQ